MKFLVVSSDVIYPAGAMQDYEANFYLPFQGFAKPIYAIPGNHDWFDALEGFNANFLEPKAARAAIEARVEADLGLTSTNARRIDQLMTEAARLRGLYGVDVGTQRAVVLRIADRRISRCWRSIPASCARSTNGNGHGSSARSTAAAASSSWRSSAIRASPAAMIFRRRPKAMMSPNPRKTSPRSISSWRTTTSELPWPAIRMTSSITGKKSAATVPRA